MFTEQHDSQLNRVRRVADLMVAVVTGEQHYQLACYELMLEVADARS